MDIRILCRLPRCLRSFVWAGLLLLILLAGFAARPAAGQIAPHRVEPGGIAIENSPQLFAVLSALSAAGVDVSPRASAIDPGYEKLRVDLQSLNGPATEALRQFYRDQQLGSPNENISRYISFALLVGPPPHFSYLLSHDQLPPDVLTIEGFQDVLTKFYAEAELERRWSQLAPAADREVVRLRAPLSQLILVSSSYLREVLKPAAGRSFTVYVEPLVGNHTNFRNFGDHYSVVVGSGSHPPLDDIRHSFLHYLLDPLPIRFRPLIDGTKPLFNIAARAPRLSVNYQQDYTSYFTECLVRAVELRLRRADPAALEAALIEADRSGFVLVRPLVARLQVFEKAEPAMHYYFPDLVRGIDVAAEQKRLQGIQFAEAEAQAEKSFTETTAHQPSDLERWLMRGERQIAVQDAAGAAATFDEILEKYPDLPRAVFGLAVASVLQGKADRAKQLFERIVALPASGGPPSSEAAPVEPGILAWSHVYLGRIHDLSEERELALNEYRAALTIAGAPENARTAADKGIATAYQPVKKRPRAEPQKQ